MEFLPKLSQNLLEIFNVEEYYNITIEVQLKNDGTLAHVELPNITPETFQYIYGGKLSVEEYDIPDLLKILVSELNLQEQSNYLQSFLVENNASWVEQNFNLVEFSDKVLPYKKILPKGLYMDLLKTFLNLHPYSRPSGKSKPRNYVVEPKIIIDSKIITNQHAKLVLKWIDKLDIVDELASHEFKLILRGSRDGFSISKFHEMCDNKSHTVTIAKVKMYRKLYFVM
ncbi:BTB/POZ protein [Rhizophagus clarus]|uniref:BTB/POZ protein n=1 Tax=Rhizophagus clarus TaxID=94130 RepID=A0A8H3QY60_9GLOM|nr:BTB/POZ protein [Rhizophagus clarus]